MDALEIPWSQTQDLQPNDVIVYEHKSRERFGEAKVVQTTNGIEIVATSKKYTMADWSPSRWIKENITTSVPPGGHLQYVKVRRKLFGEPQPLKQEVKKQSDSPQKSINHNNTFSSPSFSQTTQYQPSPSVFSTMTSNQQATRNPSVPPQQVNPVPILKPENKIEPKRKYITESERKEIFARTQGTCYLCRQKLPERGWHVEHIIPFSKNPDMDHGGNYLPACKTCNLRKGARNLDTVVLGCKTLHPDVLAILKKAKEQKHAGENFSYVAIRIDPDDDKLIDIEDGIGYLPLYEYLEDATMTELNGAEFDLNVMEPLDVGGRSEVLKYNWKGKMVAVKNLLKSNKEEFEKEIKIQSKLNHPNIMPCIGYFEKTGRMHMVMELMPYSLADWLKDDKPGRKPSKKVPELDPLKASIEIATALEYMHSQNMIHRDLKPANVLLDSKLTVKLADFGAATLTDATRQGTRVNSGYYSAPELKEEGQYNAAVDIFSFGRILLAFCNEEGGFQELSELGRLCEVKDPRKRPSIEVVLKKLQDM